MNPLQRNSQPKERRSTRRDERDEIATEYQPAPKSNIDLLRAKPSRKTRTGH